AARWLSRCRCWTAEDDMLTDDGKHLYVSWDEYHMLIERLALKIDASGWQFDQILCLARGGMRPGDVLSRVFDKPLAIMATSSYRAEAGPIQGRLGLAKYITLPRGELARRGLLVEPPLSHLHGPETSPPTNSPPRAPQATRDVIIKATTTKPPTPVGNELLAEVEGTVQGHRDGHGFVVRDDHQADLFLSPQEMKS